MLNNFVANLDTIKEMEDFEIDGVFAGSIIAGRVFGALGIVQTIIWAGGVAYDAGRWVGRH